MLGGKLNVDDFIRANEKIFEGPNEVKFEFILALMNAIERISPLMLRRRDDRCLK